MTRASLLPSSTVLFKEMDEGAVLFCSRSEVYFGLNPVGVILWKELVAGDRTESDLVEALHARYPEVDRPILEADTAEFLTALEADGLLARRGGGDGGAGAA